LGLLPLCYSKVAQKAYLAIVLCVSAPLLLTGIDRFLIDAYLDLEWHLLRERNKVKLVDAGLLYDHLIMDHFVRGI
jgi:hypothetical protein